MPREMQFDSSMNRP
nr:unnamed protein product [Callosobruchus chinensis]